MFKQLKEEGFDVFMMSFCFSVIALLLQGFSINDDANKKQAAVEKLRQEARGNEKLNASSSTITTEEQKAVVDYEYQLGT